MGDNMAVGIIMDFPGGHAGQYDAVQDGMQLGGVAPPGAIFHAAGPTDTGWRVVDVWESAEQFQEFATERIAPLSQQHGLPEPGIQMFEVADSFDQRGDGIGFIQVVRLDGMDRATFEDADGDIRADGNPAECRFHVNGETESGQIVVDAWSSKEARDAFLGEHIVPAMQSRGLAPPAIEDMSVHNTLSPA
jgi:hypothetical protein